MGVINETMLNKDAKHILFYAEEEKNALQNICTNLANIVNCYSSPNSKRYAKKVEKTKNNIDVIYGKRNRYANILYQEIKKYKRLAAKTVRKFEEEGRNL